MICLLFLKYGYWVLYIHSVGLSLMKTVCECVGASDEEHYEQGAHTQAMTVHQQKVTSAGILAY